MTKAPEKARRPWYSPLLEGYRPYLFLLALGLLVYGQSLFFGFTYCDDYKMIVEEHDRIRGFSQVLSAFVTGFGHLYRPLLKISLVADEALGGIDPVPFHLTNGILHLIATCLVFQVLVTLSFRRGAAFMASAVFAVHPLLVQAVVWIPGRNDSLVTIFTLLAFMTLIRLARAPSWPRLGLHLLLFALALLSKETAALFPVAALFYLYFLSEKSMAPRWTFGLIAGWACVGLLWLVGRSLALRNVVSPDEVGWKAFLANWPAIPALTGKAVLPLNLSGLATFDAFSITSGALVLVAMALCLVFVRARARRGAGFGCLWYLVFLLPALFARVVTADDHFDYLEHRAYLPFFGLLVFILSLVPARANARVRAAWIAVLCLFSLMNIHHARGFSDPVTFWERAVAYDPSRSNFHSVLGKLYFERGDLDRAETCFLTAVERSVLNDPANYQNLAVIYKKREAFEKAEAMGRKAIEGAPDNGSYRYFLGKLLFDRNEFDAAEPLLEEAFRLDPELFDAAIHLVAIQARRGRIDLAVAYCEKILEKDPTHFHALNIAGDLYARLGRDDEAASCWQRILANDADHVPSRLNLLRYHLKRGEFDAARAQAAQVLKQGRQIPPELQEALDRQDQ